MRQILQAVVLCVLFEFVISLPVSADEPSGSVTTELSKENLAPNQALEDVQRFLSARIPLVSQLKSADEYHLFAETTRAAALDRVVFRGPAAEWRKAWTKVERLDTIEGGSGYTIQKLRLEVLPDMWIPALLYVPEKLEEKVPVFLNVNGHDRAGKAADYKQSRCIHMARNGIMALNLEWFAMGQLATPGFSHARMNQLDLCGASGVAPFYLAMSRALDFLLSLDNADETRVGVAGLSGGGWQTIFISSLDTRVTLCNPVAGYSSFRTRIDNFSDLGDSEQTPVDLGITADYAHLTAMLAPRAALLTFNEKDNCCFASGHAMEPLMNAAAPVYKLLGQENRLRTHVNSDPGTHNFLLDNRQALYAMIRDQWYDGSDEAFPAIEQPLTDELKTAEILNVLMPSENIDFQALALSLAETLPKTAARPADGKALVEWRSTETARLRAVVRPLPGKVVAEEISSSALNDVSVTQWKLSVGNAWHVPAVEFSTGEPSKTAMVICDEGRKKSADHIERLLKEGFRVIAFDPFYFGESAFKTHAYLWALMVSTTGERPLGIQAGQIISIAGWVKETRQSESIMLVTSGPRTSLIGLVSAALEPKLISSVDEHQPLETLKTVLRENYTFDKAPELFCTGLLEVTDIPQLRELIRP